MVVYKIREIESFIQKVGFELNTNHKESGDHRIFTSPNTDFSVSIPQNSNGTLPSGTAETILNLVLLDMFIAGIDVSDKYLKPSQKISNYMIKQQNKIKKNPLLIIPNTLRVNNNITNEEQLNTYLQHLKDAYNSKKTQITASRKISHSMALQK